MNTEELRQTQAKLHAELAQAGQLDAESRRLLTEIMQDIALLVDRPAAAPAGPPDSAIERLETVAVRFEAGHPALAALLRRAVDLLGNAGV